MTSQRVALITGGAFDIGRAVATEMSKRPEWTIHILDLNSSDSSIAVSIGTSFHECNITDKSALAAIFKSVFRQHQRLDFVFVNAGIAERANFYEDFVGQNGDEPMLPVKGMHALVDINLKGVITTTISY